MNNSRRLLFLLACLIVGYLAFYLTTIGSTSKGDTIIQIAVSPASSKVTINGNGAGAGNNYVGYAGNYTVNVSKAGFKSRSESVTLSLGESQYVGLALESDSSTTANWYEAHSGDATLSDEIGSHNADAASSKAVTTNPFLGKLPLVYGDGSGGLISISQGVPLVANGIPAIYVNAATPADRQGVLKYMVNNGYDPAVSDMVFNQVNIPLGVTNE